MFIIYLTDKSKKHITGKLMEYKHMAIAVDSEEKLEFMTEIMPKKLTVKEVRNQLQNASDTSDSEGGEEEAESGEEEEDESSADEVEDKTTKKSESNDEDSDCVVLDG